MISVEHLTKYYGDFKAVDDLSFEIEEGHVYGFLGPNGAGKSTTMNIITGCLSATEGRITIGGHDILDEPKEAKKLIGYLPEQPPLYLNETPQEYLTFVAQAKGVKKADLEQEINSVVSQTGIDGVRFQLISTLSKGYRQRVGIAQALLGNPGVIILDEPTVGLDPIQIIEIRDLIKNLGRSHTVIFSSHILSEVRAICDRIMIISSGRLVAFDTPENLETIMAGTNEIDIKAICSSEMAESIASGVDGISEVVFKDLEDGTVQGVITAADDDLRGLCCRLFFAFADNRVPVYELNIKKANLEDVFIELTENQEPEIIPEDIPESEKEDEN